MFHHSHHLNSVVALPKDNLRPFCQAAQNFKALQLNPTNVPGYSWKDILSEVPVGVDFAFFAWNSHVALIDPMYYITFSILFLSVILYIQIILIWHLTLDGLDGRGCESLCFLSAVGDHMCWAKAVPSTPLVRKNGVRYQKICYHLVFPGRLKHIACPGWDSLLPINQDFHLQENLQNWKIEVDWKLYEDMYNFINLAGKTSDPNLLQGKFCCIHLSEMGDDGFSFWPLQCESPPDLRML